jgi:NADH:quinone reductase (non-electrogenic)
VASQQGKYIGRKLSKLAKQHKVLAANELYDDDDATYDKPFSYLHLGSLAYIGNAVGLLLLPLPSQVDLALLPYLGCF